MSLRSSFLLAFCLVPLVGCSNESGVVVSGRLTFNGVPNAGEIVVEPIAKDGKPLPGYSSATVFADASGEFSATLKTSNDPSSNDLADGSGLRELQCRLAIRIDSHTQSGRPAAFDYDAPPEKRVVLRRLVRDASRFHLAVTQ